MSAALNWTTLKRSQTTVNKYLRLTQICEKWFNDIDSSGSHGHFASKNAQEEVFEMAEPCGLYVGS